MNFFAAKLGDLRAHLRDPLYRNGYALILNTGLTAVLGMAYWILAAHFYSTAAVGRTSALVSGMMLISTLTQLNLASVLMRFIGRAGDATRRLVLGSYAAATAFAAVATAILLLVAHVVSKANSSLHMSFGFGLWFVVATSAWSVFALQDATLTGLRKSIWVPVENGLFGLAKIACLFAFLPLMGAAGLFSSWTVPVLISLVPVNLAILRRFIPAHRLAARAQQQPLDRNLIKKYLVGDYLSSLFAQGMTTFVPVLVISQLGSSANAYFYTAQTISLTLDLVSANLTNSLVAELAGQEHRTADMAKALLRKIFALVTPLGIVMFLAAPLVLSAFGAKYSHHATTLLRLLIIATLPRIVLVVYAAVARLEHKTHRNALLSSLQAVLMIAGSVVLMHRYGINGVGYAALGSQALVTALTIPWLIRLLRRPSRPNPITN